MRILYILSESSLLKVYPHVVSLISYLKSQEISAEIFCLGQPSVRVSEEASQKDIVIHFTSHAGFNADTFKALRMKVQKDGFGIIHTFDPISFKYGAWLKTTTFKKWVHSIPEFVEERWPFFPSLLCDQFVFSSESDRQRVGALNRHCKTKSKVIYPSVITEPKSLSDQEKKTWRQNLGLKDDSLIVFNCGALVKEEDHETLFKAFKKIILKKFNAELILSGSGPLKDELKKKAEEYQIANNVKFINEKVDTNVLLSLSDMMVISSFSEGIPSQLFSAMNAKKPTVITKISGREEIISDNQEGFLIPCGYPERIESSIMRYYANRPLLTTHGEAAYKKMTEVFGASVVFSKYLKIY